MNPSTSPLPERNNPRLLTLIKRQPCCVTAETPIFTALQQMSAARIGSIVIVDAQQRPVGIFTNYDLLRRVVVPKVDMASPIGEVMSVPPLLISQDASAVDAMLEMATQGVHHIILIDAAGVITGVISERDLFALQRVGVMHLRSAIAAAKDIADLIAALSDVRHAAFSMLDQGAGAEQITQFISAANDSVVRRVIEFNLRQHDFEGIEWAWLAFGSEGREEQTMSTDQDNGIVFICPDVMDRDPLQLRFLAFARDVNNDLDACGFPLCKGNIMASNPDWCLTLDQWREKFSIWIGSPQPEALLNATIFFDIRALYGHCYLANPMYKHLLSEISNNNIFQRMLASQALNVWPPLGLIRDFTTETENGRHFIDLKKFGSRLFVDAARVLALTQGVYTANTIARLRQAMALSGTKDDIDAIIDAFNFIQLLRLRHQYRQEQNKIPCDNRVSPDDLNQLDRRILLESFKQVKRLQQSLKLHYQI